MSLHTPQPDPLETVLHGLRSAEPAPGFHTRLLSRLDAPALPATPVPRRPRLLTVLPLTAALAAALLLVLVLPHPRTHQPTPTAVTKAPAASLASQAPRPGGARALLPLPATRPHPHAAPTLAEVETNAPSLPPPPLPLTAEERNIHHFRSLHSAVSLAALSPDAVDLHQAADQQATHDFFDPDHKEN